MNTKQQVKHIKYDHVHRTVDFTFVEKMEIPFLEIYGWFFSSLFILKLMDFTKHKFSDVKSTVF